ncbi:tetraspanin-10 [Olea europaea subsp. europaea]|uniref:Tetraspanin-10 n=1 Tax=Olea europaea subsp. europaea TaxID=158383 RepID=A0A8S0S8P7_OLEEU|nr:tetraspanin-10 [Olea europaea subsp. europaea]
MLLLHCLKFWMRWFNRNFRNRLQHLVEIAILDIFYARFKFSVQLLSIAVIGFGVWMSTHHDGCRKALTIPVLGLGAVIFLISIIGFMGAWKNNSILLWIYLILLCIVLVAILVFTVLAFIITNNGSGHNVTGLRYKEYQLQDYSSWFLKQLNNSHNWNHLKSCLVKSDDCNNLSRKYKTLKQFKSAKLSPVEAGCCRPPSECGYPVVNASFYDLSFRPISSNKDCRLYKNAKAIKCYNCDSWPESRNT